MVGSFSIGLNPFKPRRGLYGRCCPILAAILIVIADCGLSVIGKALPPGQAVAAEAKANLSGTLISGSFSSLHEPSGIVRLDKKTVIVIEDEMARPLRQLTIDTNNSANNSANAVTIIEHSMATADGFFSRRLLGPLDDLEGIARIDENRFLAIGSHDDAHKNKPSLRQKLILFILKDGKVSSFKVRKDLYRAIRKQYPQLAEKFKKARRSPEDALNIEGMAFDRKRSVLYIGLRSPRLKSDAVILTLTNPFDYLLSEKAAVFDEAPWQLELDKGGIRALTYDDKTDKLVIVSQRESGNKQRFKLWSVRADRSQPPTRLLSDNKKLFKNVEGLTTLGEQIFFVKDNGVQLKQQGAGWFVLHRKQLGID